MSQMAMINLNIIEKESKLVEGTIYDPQFNGTFACPCQLIYFTVLVSIGTSFADDDT